MEKVSIIIPVYNEEKYIRRAVETLLDDDYPRHLLEVLIIDGGSNDNTLRILEDLQKTYPFVKILHNPRRITPVSLNIGIKNATGDIILRADAHSFYEKNYISRLVYWLKKLDAGNVGGRFVNSTLSDSKQSIAIARIWESPFGVGNAKFRTAGGDRPIETDTVPYGCWRREIFDRVGLFNEKLARNQDIELNRRIRASGKKIFLIPGIRIFYHPRETYGQLARYALKNGYWNILTVFYTRTMKSLSLRHFVPLFFTLGILLLAAAAIFYPPAGLLSLFLLGIYFFAATFFAFKIKNRTGTTIANIVAGFFILHFFYGLGELAAIISLPFKKQ